MLYLLWIPLPASFRLHWYAFKCAKRMVPYGHSNHFTLAILSVKGLVAGLAAVILAYPLRIAIIVGLLFAR